MGISMYRDLYIMEQWYIWISCLINTSRPQFISSLSVTKGRKRGGNSKYYFSSFSLSHWMPSKSLSCWLDACKHLLMCNTYFYAQSIIFIYVNKNRIRNEASLFDLSNFQLSTSLRYISLTVTTPTLSTPSPTIPT